MIEKEIKKYLALNELAEPSGIVILGNEEDKEIPLCELKQAFALDSRLYNRSITGLSIENAIEVYESCVASLNPDTVLLHIGKSDLELFRAESAKFAQKYREFIKYIRTKNKKSRIGIISLGNPANNNDITELNKHLKYIAESEQCEYGDIATKRIWNPKETKDIVSFIYSTGFVRSLKNKRPLYDLVKILFCYESKCIE